MSLAELLSVLVQAIFLLTQGHARRVSLQIYRSILLRISHPALYGSGLPHMGHIYLLHHLVYTGCTCTLYTEQSFYIPSVILRMLCTSHLPTGFGLGRCTIVACSPPALPAPTSERKQRIATQQVVIFHALRGLISCSSAGRVVRLGFWQGQMLGLWTDLLLGCAQ